jgi:hypothetical protein
MPLSSRVCGSFCRFWVFYTGLPSALPPVSTVWHAPCFVYEPDKRYTEIAVKTTQQTNSSRNKNKTVKFNIINKVILIAASVAAIASSASANLGDTHAQSNARYGKTYRNDGFTGISIYAPKGRGWMIYEWFNENGIVEAIEYYQVNGKYITQQQGDKLTAINGIQPKGWPKVASDAAGDIWFSPDNNWRIEVSWDGTMGNQPMHRMILSTLHGDAGMRAALGGGTNQQQQVVNTDLPVSL